MCTRGRCTRGGRYSTFCVAPLVALIIYDIPTSLDGYVTGPDDSRENPIGDGAEMLHD